MAPRLPEKAHLPENWLSTLVWPIWTLVGMVLEHLPGRSVEDALNLLKFMPTPHARLVAKIVKSAAANAENNYAMDTEVLYVKRYR